jgi:nuclear cap-binding protein subunit 1
LLDVPYAAEARQIQQLIRKRAADSEIDVHIEAIQAASLANGDSDPLIASTDAFVTSICFVGSKSLSHVLSCIERCKERLLAIGPQSEAARRQVITSVLGYWHDLPGIAVNIVDKLLNYTIVTPESVIRWSLGEEQVGPDGLGLVNVWRYEMVAFTMGKVTNRVRQIVNARVSAVAAEEGSLTDEQIAVVDDTLKKEREAMRALFALIIELASPYEKLDSEAAAWSARWIRVFRRKAAVEESITGEAAVITALDIAKIEAEIEKARKQKEEEERERRRQEREIADAKRLEEEAKAAEEAAAKAAAEEDKAQANGGAQQELDVADDDL